MKGQDVPERAAGLGAAQANSRRRHRADPGCRGCLEGGRASAQSAAGRGSGVSAGVACMPPQLLHTAFTWMRGQRRVGAPMADYTSLRIGGPADVLLVPADLEELRAIVVWASARGVPITWLGNGSNLLVRARGIRGIVVWLRKALNQIALLDPHQPYDKRPGDPVHVRVGAGVPLTRVLHV